MFFKLRSSSSERVEPAVAQASNSVTAAALGSLQIPGRGSIDQSREVAPRCAPWQPDRTLFPACEKPRALVVAFGGFRECGPYHFGSLGEQLQKDGCIVHMASLLGHAENEVVPTLFSSQNLMSKAVNDVQEALQHGPQLPLILMGFSAGGLVALQLAQRFAFQPVRAVICEGLFLQSPSAIRRAYPLMLRLQRSHLSREKWKEIASGQISYSPSSVSDSCRSADWDARPRVPAVTRAAILGLDDFRRETIALVKNNGVPCPMYLAHGKRDPSSSLGAVEGMLRSPNIRGGANEILLLSHSAHSLALGPERKIYVNWVQHLIMKRSERCSTGARPEA